MRSERALFRFHVIILADGKFRLIVDEFEEELHNQVHDLDLTGIHFTRCAVWNGQAGSLPMEGSYEGTMGRVLWLGRN